MMKESPFWKAQRARFEGLVRVANVLDFMRFLALEESDSDAGGFRENGLFFPASGVGQVENRRGGCSDRRFRAPQRKAPK